MQKLNSSNQAVLSDIYVPYPIQEDWLGFALVAPNPLQQEGKVLNYAGKELTLSDFTGIVDHCQTVQVLDLRSTKLARSENGHYFFNFFLERMPALREIHIDGAAWLGDLWMDPPSAANPFVRQAEEEEEEGDRLLPTFCPIERYGSVFNKILFDCSDRSGKMTSVQEMRRWAGEVFHAPSYLFGKAYAFFFARFPTIETIVCKIPKDPSLFFDTRDTYYFENSDLKMLLEAIPPNYRKISLDLSDSPFLTASAFSLLQQFKGNFTFLNLLRNPWMKLVLCTHFQTLKDLIRLDDPQTKCLDANSLFSWVEMYPEEVGKKLAVEALFEVHPDIVSLNFSNSKMTRELAALAVETLGERCQTIDLSATPLLNIEMLTLIASMCPNLHSLDVKGNGWMKAIWNLESVQFQSFASLFSKLKHSLAGEKRASLKEIYGWGEMLGAPKTRFEEVCALFFARFSSREELDASSCSTTPIEFGQVLQKWPFGKNNQEAKGELHLHSLKGLNEAVFLQVQALVPNVTTIYIDEEDGIFQSAPIRKIDSTTGGFLVSKLALRSGPETGTISYKMIQKWKWIVEKFYVGNKEGLFSSALGSFFTRYANAPVVAIDCTGSEVTDGELEQILKKCIETYPNCRFALSLNKCSKLTQESFALIHTHCVRDGVSVLSSLSIDEGSALAKGILATHMEFFWENLVFARDLSATDELAFYLEFEQWHALMGSGAYFAKSCERFFIRFPKLRKLDLEGENVVAERLNALFESWSARLGEGDTLQFNFSSSPLSDQVVQGLQRHLRLQTNEVILSNNSWVTDQTIVGLLVLPNLKKIGIDGCPQVSDEMIGLCEPLLEGQKYLETTSYRDLSSILVRDKLLSYFLHHPKMKTIDLACSQVSQESLADILYARSQAKERWGKKNWDLSIETNKPGWTVQGEIGSILLDSCPHLVSRNLAAVHNFLREISFLGVSQNKWVLNDAVEFLDKRETELQVDVYGCKNITPDVEGRLKKVSLTRPYWTTPVDSEQRVTASQIIHHATTCSMSHLEKARKALFDVFQQKLLPKLEGILLSGMKSAPLLLPYQKEAIAFLMGEEFSKIQDAALVAKIKEMGNEQSTFSHLEGAIEGVFFLLKKRGLGEDLLLRQEIMGELLEAYAAFLPKEHWDLDPKFTYRAASAFGIPSALIDEKEYPSSPKERAEHIEGWFTIWQEKVEALLKQRETIVPTNWNEIISWNKEWAFWTGESAQGAVPSFESCKEVPAEIANRIKKQREFFYSAARAESAMKAYPQNDQIDLSKSQITSWQLEAILRAIADRSIVLLDLSYTPHLSTKELASSLGRFSENKVQQLKLNGNLWVNDAAIALLRPYVDPDSIEHERCVHVTDACVEVYKIEEFTMSDERTTADPVHITRIRDLLIAPGDLSEKYRIAIRNQAYVFTNISCSGSDIDGNELFYLLKALKIELGGNNNLIELDLSYCSSLTPSCLSHFSEVQEKISFLSFAGNRWISGTFLIADLIPRSEKLQRLNLIDCPNISQESLERFIEVFFEEREKKGSVNGVGLSIATVLVDKRPFYITLQKGEQYGVKLHEMLAKKKTIETFL